LPALASSKASDAGLGLIAPSTIDPIAGESTSSSNDCVLHCLYLRVGRQNSASNPSSSGSNILRKSRQKTLCLYDFFGRGRRKSIHFFRAQSFCKGQVVITVTGDIRRTHHVAICCNFKIAAWGAA
jgi:hypothetical protein